MTDPRMDLHQTFDAVHDGAVAIDTDRCALALFVTLDGQVRVKSPYTTVQVVDMLRQLAELVAARP